MLSWLQTKSVDILYSCILRDVVAHRCGWFYWKFPKQPQWCNSFGTKFTFKIYCIDLLSICSKNNSQRAHLEHHKSAYIYFLHIANLKLIMINAAANQPMIDTLPLFSTSPTKLLSSAFLCDLSIRQWFWSSSKLKKTLYLIYILHFTVTE